MVKWKCNLQLIEQFFSNFILHASNEKVSHIKNFLPGDPVGVAGMSETLWDVENLLRLGWTSSAASRLRKLASKCDFQEWPRKIHKIVQNICKFSLNCQEAALKRRGSTALAQARVGSTKVKIRTSWGPWGSQGVAKVTRKSASLNNIPSNILFPPDPRKVS